MPPEPGGIIFVADGAGDFRAAFLLRADEDLSFREIGEVLQITEENARWRSFWKTFPEISVSESGMFSSGVLLKLIDVVNARWRGFF